MASKLIKVVLLVVLAAALSTPIASAKRYDPPGTSPAKSSGNPRNAPVPPKAVVGRVAPVRTPVPCADNVDYDDYYHGPCSN
ncbi:MAG: hypothetical protein ACXVZN_08035 [Gaiellaceae bacterium]